jgi:hypothetical protein
VLARAIIQEECQIIAWPRHEFVFLDRGLAFGAIGIGSVAAILPVPWPCRQRRGLRPGVLILPKAANKPKSLL